MKSTTRVALGLLSLGAAAMALGCGGDSDSTAPVTRAMGDVDQQLNGSDEPFDTEGGNAAPVIRNVEIDPRSAVSGQPLRAVVDSWDPDGDYVRLSISWYLNGQLIAEGQPTVTIDKVDREDRIEVRVSGSDGRLESRVETARVGAGNRAPYMTRVYVTPDNQLIRRGERLMAHPEGSDLDNDELSFSYRWLANGRVVSRDRELDTAKLKRGDKVVAEVVANDGQADSLAKRSYEIEMSNSPPVITVLPKLEVLDGELRYVFKATDADGDRNLRFWVEDGPAGMQMDSLSGELRWKPRADQAGVHPVQVGVKDGFGDGTQFEFQVTVNADAGAPPASAR